jgi:hypothetical protein
LFGKIILRYVTIFFEELRAEDKKVYKRTARNETEKNVYYCSEYGNEG